ncbi:MAG: hypothetical protein PHE68_01545 [Candidatus Peribacteraceae bacterium]|nr:hypothetical protein [Candidatus Peribacteraceae bacterium]MDD5075158.1 hypothetical protein [Candidatus Peribacteraceae bacterium]
MSAWEGIKSDTAKPFDITSLPVKAAETGFMKLAGEPFLAKMKHETAQSIWDVMMLPPRILKHAGIGVLKGSLKLGRGVLSRISILPMWSAERQEQKTQTRQDLNALANRISPKQTPGTLGNSLEKLKGLFNTAA